MTFLYFRICNAVLNTLGVTQLNEMYSVKCRSPHARKGANKAQNILTRVCVSATA